MSKVTAKLSEMQRDEEMKYKVAVHIAILTGMRRGEILNCYFIQGDVTRSNRRWVTISAHCDTYKNRLLQAVMAILYSYYKIKFLRLLIHFECKRTPPKFCVPKT
jgi:hypothetical protein